MKAYAVVRKPEPSNKIIQHTIRLQRKNPQITIEPIQHNKSITPRKAQSTLANHLLQSKSRHFKIEEESTKPNRLSSSPPRKHPIFHKMISDFLQQKTLKESIQNVPSAKFQQNSQFSPHSSRFQKKSEAKIDSRLNSQNRQIYTTPQKIKYQEQKITPYQILNKSQKERQPPLLIIPHRHRIFEQYHNTSRQKRLKSRQRSQTKVNTFQRNLGPQLELIQSKFIEPKIQNAPINRQLSQYLMLQVHHQAKYDHIREQNLYSSEVDLGCCGENIVKRTNEANQDQNSKVKRSFSRNQNNNNNTIINGIGIQFLNRVSDRSTEKIRKRIFSEHNPELQKSIDRETVSYKEDKIKAKPIIEEKKSKTRKVTVFEVCRYSPFEF